MSDRSFARAARHRPTTRTLLLIGLALPLAGALAFGAWHVVVGGLIHGNPRAAAFGVALSALSGGLLAGLATLARRRG